MGVVRLVLPSTLGYTEHDGNCFLIYLNISHTARRVINEGDGELVKLARIISNQGNNVKPGKIISNQGDNFQSGGFGKTRGIWSNQGRWEEEICNSVKNPYFLASNKQLVLLKKL